MASPSGAGAADRDNMAERPQTIVLCSCDDTMPLDTDAVRRGCRGAKVETAGQLCRAELERFRAAAAAGGPLTVGCTQEAPLFAEVAQASGKEASLTFVNVRETAGWSSQAADAGPKMAALLAAAAEPAPEVPFVTLTSDGVILIYGRDEQAIEAANLLKEHLDVTVMISKPAALAPTPGQRIPGGEGHDPLGQRLSRRLRDRGRRFCQLPRRRRATHSTFGAGARRRGIALRHHTRHFRQRTAVSGVRSARRLSARRSARSGRRAARGDQGARSRRYLRQAALHRVQRRPLRAFAFAHRRLPPLSRSLSDRRHRARRRSRRHRCQHLCRLRPVRRRMSDRRSRLCAAAGRCADAQAAHAA